MQCPEMYALRQCFARECEIEPAAAVQREVQKLSPKLRLNPGERVAISVGSRGVCNLDNIVRSLVDNLKGLGARPFLFPAMGSHGGGAAEGQLAVLERYGITEQTMGCPILASMEVVQLGQSDDGIPIFLDRHASQADHVVVLNRVKRHTEFKGEIESGLMKMLLIGMGKHQGASIYHRAFVDYGFDQIVQKVARIVIEKAKVLFALAIVENAYEETALIRALLPQEIVEAERELLRKANELAAKLPFDDVDVLIVDEMGKNISGAGMDTNVTGRYNNRAISLPRQCRVKRIYVRDLTPESMGNAAGIGAADFIHRNIMSKIDFRATNTNCLTAIAPEQARIPIVCGSDREALEYCFATIGLTSPQDACVMRIRNTLHLIELDVSRAFLKQINGRPDLKILAGPAPLEFDATGNLGPMLARHAPIGALSREVSVFDAV